MLNREFKKSSRSQTSNCPQARLNGQENIEFNDSLDPNGPTLTFTPSQWQAHIEGVKAGEFDLPEGLQP